MTPRSRTGTLIGHETKTIEDFRWDDAWSLTNPTSLATQIKTKLPAQPVGDVFDLARLLQLAGQPDVFNWLLKWTWSHVRRFSAADQPKDPDEWLNNAMDLVSRLLAEANKAVISSAYPIDCWKSSTRLRRTESELDQFFGYQPLPHARELDLHCHLVLCHSPVLFGQSRFICPSEKNRAEP